MVVEPYIGHKKMTTPKEDDAFESFFEINYNEVPTHLLKDQYESVEVGRIMPSEFGRWTRVDDLGTEFSSEGFSYPKQEMIGLYFSNVKENRRDAFISINSIKYLQDSNIKDRDESGNSPHCKFCVNPNTRMVIKWVLDSTYSFHPKCARKFRQFLFAVMEEHKDDIAPHLI